MDALPALPDAPAPLSEEVTLAVSPLEDAVAPPSVEEEEEQEPLHPDDFLSFITAHGWVRDGELEEHRQTRAEATQRLADIQAGRDGVSLAAHASDTGGVPGGSAGVAALLADRPATTKARLTLPSSPTGTVTSAVGAVTRA